MRLREYDELKRVRKEVDRQIQEILKESITIEDLAEVSPYDGVYGF
jgi:hypothetical protein